MSWIGGFFGNKKSAAPGNVTVNVTLPDPLPVTLPFKHIIRDKNKERRWETNKDVKIDEGWYFIDIYNPTLNIIKIEVSGQTEIISPGGRWTSQDRIDWEHYTQELGPPIVVFSNGENYWIHVCYPNDSSVDVWTL